MAPVQDLVERSVSGGALAAAAAARLPIRLLVVCHTHPRFNRGGAQAVAYENFQRAAQDPNFVAWFFASNGPASSSKLGVRVHQPFGSDEYIHSGTAYDALKLSNPDPAFEREFGRILQETRPDIVHFHHFLGVGVEAFLYVRRYAPQAKILLTLHEYLLICLHHGQMVTRPDYSLCHRENPQDCHRCFPDLAPELFVLRKLWLQRMLSEVDYFLTPSAFLSERHRDWGLPAGKLVHMQNLLPKPITSMTPEVPRPSTDGVFRVGFFGQLSPLKGIDVLLRAAVLLKQREASISIEIHGSADSQPESFQRHVAKLFEQLPENVVLRGRYEEDEVGARMRSVDAVVVPSIWWENAPVVIEEALREGRIVVGSALGGIAEALQRTDRGHLFPVGDHVALAGVLQGLGKTRQDRSGLPITPSYDEIWGMLKSFYCDLVKSPKIRQQIA